MHFASHKCDQFLEELRKEKKYGHSSQFKQPWGASYRYSTTMRSPSLPIPQVLFTVSSPPIEQFAAENVFQLNSFKRSEPRKATFQRIPGHHTINPTKTTGFMSGPSPVHKMRHFIVPVPTPHTSINMLQFCFFKKSNCLHCRLQWDKSFLVLEEFF